MIKPLKKIPYNIINWDNLHYNFRQIDGYDKVFNFIISGRGSGKSTAMALFKLLEGWKKRTPFIVFRRKKVDLNEEYLNSLNGVINKFLDKSIIFEYKKASVKTGEVDVFVNGELFARFIALSCNLAMIKSYFVKDCGGLVFDEFIISLKNGEKYLPDEFFKFQETYTTYARESKRKLKCYFMGNPYSLFNPYFMGFKIDPKKLKLGEIYSPKGSIYAVEYYSIKDELKEQILEKNPLFNFDEEYLDYAVNGSSVDDRNINLVKKHPNGFKLYKVFFVENNNIAIYANTTAKGELSYWVSLVDVQDINRNVYCLDINDLSKNRVVLSFSELRENRNLANAMRLRRIGFQDINSYYLFVEIYKLL